MSSHLVIGVHAFDCINRIKWCRKLLSAKQVNNEDLDHQLGPQTLTALLTPLELIDQGFRAGSAQLSGKINCHAQIPSYHWDSFVKVRLCNEKTAKYLRLCILFFTFMFAVWFGSPKEHSNCIFRKREDNNMLGFFTLFPTCILISTAFSSPVALRTAYGRCLPLFITT